MEGVGLDYHHQYNFKNIKQISSSIGTVVFAALRTFLERSSTHSTKLGKGEYVGACRGPSFSVFNMIIEWQPI